MTRALFFRQGQRRRKAGHIFMIPLWAGLCCLLLAVAARAQTTLLVPSQPSIEAPAKAQKAEAPVRRDDKRGPEQKAAPPKAEKTAEKTEKAAEGGAKPSEANPLPAAEKAAQPPAAPAPPAESGKTESPRPDEARADGPKTETPPQPEPSIDEEVDVLITMMQPFQYEGLLMDMPQLFAVLRYDSATPARDGVAQPERRDLLGDVEEIRYLDQKAWGANVALTRPGLHQFIIEGRPWWDTAHGRFLQHYVKTTLPVYGVEHGWDLPVGQRFEILPLSRPFGLTAPTLFAGVALMDGKPLAGAPVRMVRINTEKRPVPTPWHEELAAKTDSKGHFAFAPNLPGWWCCMVTAPGDPLRGPDGQPKPLQLGALFWLYVDGAAEARKR